MLVKASNYIAITKDEKSRRAGGKAFLVVMCMQIAKPLMNIKLSSTDCYGTQWSLN